MKLGILIISPDDKEPRKMHLGSNSILGRQKSCDIRIPDNSLSRIHFLLEVGKDEIFVKDLGSRNGTLLNQKKIKGKSRLKQGDVVSAGKTHIKILSIEPGENVPKPKGNVKSDTDELLKEKAVGRVLRQTADSATTKRVTKKAEKTTPSFLPGDEIVKGCIFQRTIGKGPWGTVYKVHQPNLDRPAAVKILHKSMDLNKSIFFKSAKTVSHLEKDYLVRIFDLGEEKTKKYIIMEYLHDGPIERTPFPVKRDKAPGICRNIVYALAELHKRSLVHGNLKPSNIFIWNDGDIKLSDTAMYLNRSITAKNDVYESCRLLYNILTGQDSPDVDNHFYENLDDFKGVLTPKFRKGLVGILRGNLNEAPENAEILKKVLDL